MKKLIFIFLLIPTFLYSQTKINGIGLFKLGSLKSTIVDSLMRLTRSEVLETKDKFEVFQKRLNGIYRCTQYEGAVQCPSSEHYLIYSLNLQGIQLTEVIFGFYKDSLYEFECYGSRDLIDAVNTKYGEGKLETETKIVYCQNQVTGAQIQHEENTFITKWRWDKQVYCWNMLGNSYNDDCKIRRYNQFYLKNLIFSKKQHECLMNQNIKENEEKKKKLDKL